VYQGQWDAAQKSKSTSLVNDDKEESDDDTYDSVTNPVTTMSFVGGG
jgi:hypothetical protein